MVLTNKNKIKATFVNVLTNMLEEWEIEHMKITWFKKKIKQNYENENVDQCIIRPLDDDITFVRMLAAYVYLIKLIYLYNTPCFIAKMNVYKNSNWSTHRDNLF